MALVVVVVVFVAVVVFVVTVIVVIIAVVAVLSVLAVVAVVKKTRLLFVVTGIGFLCFSIRNQFGINRNVANPVFSRTRRLVNPNSNGFVTFVLTNSVRIP